MTKRQYLGSVLFAIFTFFSLVSFALANYQPASGCVFTVSGAGSTTVNGTYTYVGDSSAIGGTAGVNAFALNGNTNSGFYPALDYTGYYELDAHNHATRIGGFYYDSNGASGSYLTLNTNNGGGGAIPTVTVNCAPKFNFGRWFMW